MAFKLGGGVIVGVLPGVTNQLIKDEPRPRSLLRHAMVNAAQSSTPPTTAVRHPDAHTCAVRLLGSGPKRKSLMLLTTGQTRLKKMCVLHCSL